MKCYYEVLEVPRDAEASDIKTSYRKLALKWHPDKNMDNVELAKETFQLVQNAYEVLSDPQERAWYDNHRDQLLKGAGSSFNDESLDLIPYFTASCYKGFGDDSKGFYEVYREVFKKLAAEEVDYLDDPEDVSNIPMFGKSDTEYEKVHEFYSYWMSFSTAKTYVWLDKYDIREADNRRILKLLEKENQKIRQKAKKERNEEIRQLVTFIRKRDKRVSAHAKILAEKAKENKLKMEKNRKDKLIKRQQDLEEAKNKLKDTGVYHMNNFNEQLEEIEKHLCEEFGNSDDEYTSYSSNEDVENEKEEQNKSVHELVYDESQIKNLYCMACNKPFKNIKSFENHEKSKKHKENVSNLQVNENIEISGDEKVSDDEKVPNDDDVILTSDEDVLEVVKESKTKKKKNKKSIAILDDSDEESELTDLSNLDNNVRNRKGRRAKMAANLAKNKLQRAEDTAVLNENSTVEQNEEEKEELNEAIDKNTENIAKINKPKSKAKDKKSVKKTKNDFVAVADVAEIDVSHCCAVCKNDFLSKNKLFDHLKKSGHSVYIPNGSDELSNSKTKKKKSVKQR